MSCINLKLPDSFCIVEEFIFSPAATSGFTLLGKKCGDTQPLSTSALLDYTV